MKIRCLSASLSLVKLGLQNEFQQMTQLSLPYTVTRPFGHRYGISAWRVIVKAMNDSIWRRRCCSHLECVMRV
jgi:hypothetical protein